MDKGSVGHVEADQSDLLLLVDSASWLKASGFEKTKGYNSTVSFIVLTSTCTHRLFQVTVYLLWIISNG